MITVFVIAMTFKDFDDCWNFYHANMASGVEAQIVSKCEKIEIEQSFAPTSSIRPKARPEQ